MDTIPTSTAQEFLTFQVDKRLYALRTRDITEVIRVPAVARVPQSPAALMGIANLRGTVLPAVSLRGLLGLTDAERTTAARAIVLDVGSPVALIVDSVDSLIAMAADRVETRQKELSAEAGERLTGAFPAGADGRVAKILDIQALLLAAFAKRATETSKVRRIGNDTDFRDGEAATISAEMSVTFEVAGQEFALPMAVVEEILPAPTTLTAVPRAEALVLGVTSVRDALLPLLSLRGLLGFPAAVSSDARQKVVVTKVGDVMVGLVADRARAIVSADVSLIDPIPSMLAARTGGESRISAIYRGEQGRRLISILAPEQIFREDVMQRLGTTQANQNSQVEQATSVQTNELIFLVFRLGGDEFGLPIDAVDEVALVPTQIARVPKTPKFLEGVINLRGDVLPVVDQRRRFDMPKLAQSEGRRLVVVRSEKHRAGLIVDSVSDVLRVDAGSVEPPPNLTEETARLVQGVVNLEDAGRIVLLLNPTELLTKAERGLLDAFQAKSAKADA